MAYSDFNDFINNLESGRKELMPNPLIFIHKKGHIKKAILLYRLLDSIQLKPRIITQDYEIEYELRKILKSTDAADSKDTSIASMCDYINWKNSEDDIDIKAVEFAGVWYKKDSFDYSRLAGISMGDLYHRLMAYYFANILSSIKELKAVREKEQSLDFIFLEDKHDIAKNTSIAVHKNYYGRIAEVLCNNFKKKTNNYRLVIEDSSVESRKSRFKELTKRVAKRIIFVFSYWYKLIINLEKKYENNIMIRYYSPVDENLVKSFLTKPNNRVVLSIVSFDAIKHFLLKRNFICYRINTKPRHRHKAAVSANSVNFESFRNAKMKSFLYEGIDIWPIIKDDISYLFECAFYESLADIYSIIETLKRFKINKLLLDTDAGFEGRKYTFAANRIGVKSFVIQHGIAATNRPSDIGYLPFRASKFMAWDKITKDWLIKKGVNSEDVKVCGSVKIDYIKSIFNDKESAHRIIKKVNSDFNIKDTDNILLFVAQSAGKEIFPNIHIDLKENLKYIEALCKVCNSLKDVALIIKLHPSDSYISFVEQYLRERMLYSSNIHIVKKYPIDDLVLASRVVVSHYSSTILSSIAIDIPVISMNFRKLEFCAMEAFRGSDFIYKVSNSNELYEAVDSLTNNSKKRQERILKGREFLKDYFPDKEIENIAAAVI